MVQGLRLLVFQNLANSWFQSLVQLRWVRSWATTKMSYVTSFKSISLSSTETNLLLLILFCINYSQVRRCFVYWCMRWHWQNVSTLEEEFRRSFYVDTREPAPALVYSPAEDMVRNLTQLNKGFCKTYQGQYCTILKKPSNTIHTRR